jgi:outer membrane receptor protein involved in Fe transport
MKLRLIACAAMVFARAYAQETPPIVQVKASADMQRREDTASRIVISREEILRHGDASALDVMRRLPGVTVSGNAPRMRGLGAGYTQLLVNGERPVPGFSLDALSPGMIERIEIMRATTAEFSAQAIAGTINIVLRKAPGKRSREWKLATPIPRHFGSDRAEIALGDKSDGLSYTVSASLQRITNERPETGSVQHSDASGTPDALRKDEGHLLAHGYILNLNERLAWTLAAGETISWNTFASATLFRFDRDTMPAVELGPGYPYGREGMRRRDLARILRTELAWSRKLESGARLDASFSLNGNDTQRKRTYTADSLQGAPLLMRGYETSPDSSGAASTGKYAWPALGSHTLSAGWDISRNTQREHEVQRDNHPSGPAPIDFDRHTDARLRRAALYLQDEWELGKGLSLYAGVRRESSSTRSSGSDFAVAENRMAQTSPTLQALWKLPGEPRRQLRLALASSYKAPELQQLAPRRFLSLVNTESDPDQGGNPGLRPETARGADLAFETYGKDGELVSLTLGTRRIDNVILDVLRLEDGRWVISPRNSGRAQTHSLELEWKQPLEGTPWRFSLNAGRHWSEVESVTGPGNRLARQPRWNATAGAEYRSGAWGGGATLVATAAGWSRITEAQAAYTGGQRELGAYLTYRPGLGGLLRISAYNLLKQATREARSYQDPNGRTTGTFHEYNAARVSIGYERSF